jgi:Zn-finger nucleic acid-binding protein
MNAPQPENPVSLHCPNCGAQAHPEDANCSYCRAPLATVACPKCFGKLFVGMSHCPWCGTASQRKPVLKQKPLSCPRCQKPLQGANVGSSLMYECLNCGGLWVEVEVFERVCRTQEEQEAVLNSDSFGSFLAPSMEQKTAKLYIPCPVCGNIMNRMNFANCSGVIVDWCKTHGTWFDNNELRQIVGFIQKGGLKKSREREKEDLRAQQQRLRMQQRELMMQEARMGSSSLPKEDWREDSESLLDFLGSFWASRNNH